MNLFACTGNNPVDFVDPSGLITNCGQEYGLPPCNRSTNGGGGASGGNGGSERGKDNGRTKGVGGGGQNPVSGNNQFNNNSGCVRNAMKVITDKFKTLWSDGTANLERLVGNLLDGAARAGMTIAQSAAYLATGEHETLGFSTMYETNWSTTGETNYQYFERRYGQNSRVGKSMGNDSEGDGWTYRGRGFVNLTGRNKYLDAFIAMRSGKLGQNFSQTYRNNTGNAIIEMFATDAVLAGRVGAWFFLQHGIESKINSRGTDFFGARRLINPGESAKTTKEIVSRSQTFLTALRKCN